MPNDTAQISALAGYQPDEAGLASQVTALAGYQLAEAGFAAQLATLVGYVPPDPPVVVVPDIVGTVGTPATFDGSATTGFADTILSWAWTSIPAGSTVAPATTLPFPLPDNQAATPIDMTSNEVLYHANETSGTTGTDTSGNGNNATLTNATVGAAGKIGTAWQNTSAIRVTPASSVAVGTDWTLSLWYYSARPSGFATILFASSGNHHALVNNGTGELGVYSGAFRGSGAFITRGEAVWRHLVVVGTGGNTLFYIDGALAGTTVGYQITANATTIAGDPFNQYFAERVDEIAIWSRALSSTEIENIYTLQAPLYTPTPLPDNGVSNTFDLSMASNEGLYHFEGSANDSSGNGRNGTVSGATQTTGKVGSNAYAFAHADSTDIITFGSAGFDFVSADAFSFSMWVKPNASQPGVNAVLFGKTNFGTAGYALVQNGGANSNLYTLIVGTGSGLTGTGVNFALTAGAWSHVCVTRSANGAQTRIYVNNVLATDVSTLTTIASSGGITLGIGNFSAVPQAALAFNGDIDEFCVWSRELTPLEVETVYDYGNGTYAGFGETFTFTPDVAGTYTVKAEATSLWGSDSTTADAVIAAASGGYNCKGFIGSHRPKTSYVCLK